jgi:lysophospholipase L1-like esterase
VIRAAAAVSAALIGALACGVEAPAPDVPRIRVLLIGDSITAGLVSEPMGPPYAELLQQRLGERFEVLNLGCGGSSSLDWTRSRGAVMCGGRPSTPNLYESRVQPQMPAAFATVLLGTNDSQGIREDRRIPTEEYGAALREIATNLLEDGVERVLLLGPPLVPHKVAAMMRLAAYGKAVEVICQEDPRLVCGPDVRYLLYGEDFETGNMHPNGPGHVKIADALAEALLALADDG